MENLLELVEIFRHYVIPASVLLGLLIFVHEFGHFIVAKIVGVRVLKFSLGFGPKIIGKKIGDTEYVLSALPLGGYVKPLGEGPDESIAEEDKPYSLSHQSIPKRFAIIAAGSGFNIMFATFLFSIIYMVGTPMLIAKVGKVLDDAPAKTAGIKEGDIIVSVSGKKIELWQELSQSIESSGGKEIVLTVKRNGDFATFSLAPRMTVTQDFFGQERQSYKIGIVNATSKDAFITKSYNPAIALWKSLGDTLKWSKLTLIGIGMLIKSPIERRKDIGGPILIGKLAGEFAEVGLFSFILLMAMISVNLGVLNLLPIPILDGGHIFFLFLEAIKGKPISLKKMEIAQQIGLAILLSLMIFVFYNDIDRLGGITESISKFFMFFKNLL
jgi:regulator of sigma E protease